MQPSSFFGCPSAPISVQYSVRAADKGLTEFPGPLVFTRGLFHFPGCRRGAGDIAPPSTWQENGGSHAQDENAQGLQEALPRDRHGQAQAPASGEEAPPEPQDRQAETSAARSRPGDRPAGEEVRQNHGRKGLSSFRKGCKSHDTGT